MARLVIERVRRALLHDPARVHHRGVRAGLRDDRQVVRDEDEREAELVRQVREEVEDLGLHHHVERGRRLVGEENARVAGERHRDRGALAHPAGELVRVALGPVRRDADRLEQLANPGRRFLPARDAVQLHRLGDLLADAPHRVERVHRALEHHGDVLPAVRRDGLLPAGEHVDAVEQDPAGDGGGGRQQPHQREDGRGLAAAGLADHAEPRPGLDREGHALHGVQRAAVRQVEPDVEVLDLEQRRPHGSCRRADGSTRKRRTET